jgi:hypothetical protein
MMCGLHILNQLPCYYLAMFWLRRGDWWRIERRLSTAYTGARGINSLLADRCDLPLISRASCRVIDHLDQAPGLLEALEEVRACTVPIWPSVDPNLYCQDIEFGEGLVQRESSKLSEEMSHELAMSLVTLSSVADTIDNIAKRALTSPGHNDVTMVSPFDVRVKFSRICLLLSRLLELCAGL